MSQTYVQITHHHAEKLGQTNPKFIGVNFVPFPNSDIFPETSLLQADEVPRCTACSAFFNKFNKYNSKEYICSLCGKRNKFKIPNTYSDSNYKSPADSNYYIPTFNGCTNFGGENTFENAGVNSPECKYEVYDAIAKTKFRIRPNNFVPTSFFYISLSLMRTHPEIFTCIDQYLQKCYKARQIGICFLHGALTLVKQRPMIEFQTYFDDAPECRSPLYYVSSPYFRNNFQTIINKATELSYVEVAYEDDFCKNVINHSKKISLLYGTNVYYILDERDFHLFSSEKNENLIKSCSFEMLKGNVQASVILFASQNRINNFTYRNPLFDFSVITGGIFKIFPQSILSFDPNQESNIINNNISDMYNDFLNVLTTPCLDDTFIFVCPPENNPLMDFAGQGMMKSHTGISVSKIKLNDSFSFTFDPCDCDEFPYIQFVTYFTTKDNVRRMRVVTAPIMKYNTIDVVAQSVCISTFVAQRFLIEGKEKAQKIFESFKKSFKGVSYRCPEFIVGSSNMLQAAQCSLAAFNKTVYGVVDLASKNKELDPQFNQLITQQIQQTYPQYFNQHLPQEQQQQQQQFDQQVVGQQYQFGQQQILLQRPKQQQQQFQQPVQQYQQLHQTQQQFQQQYEQQLYQQQQFEQQVLQQHLQQQQFQMHLQQLQQQQQQQYEQSLLQQQQYQQQQYELNLQQQQYQQQQYEQNVQQQQQQYEQNNQQYQQKPDQNVQKQKLEQIQKSQQLEQNVQKSFEQNLQQQQNEQIQQQTEQSQLQSEEQKNEEEKPKQQQNQAQKEEDQQEKHDEPKPQRKNYNYV